ncbi:MAG: pyruvate, phosphate dikinase, partial [Gemmatimonadota bacterium]|nr:pyruvate, phosphate dikinase [Gemmatimonadota bacterium]
MANPYVFFFGGGEAEGDARMKTLLGGKGANLAEMTRIGVPVPPGFTITTEVCRRFSETGAYPDGVREQVEANLRRTEEATGRSFGGSERPLLVSVRSGGAVSMPGMMDTILNLGLNDRTVQTLAREAGDERFAWDSYRRFVQMYGNVVLGVRNERFEELLEERKREEGVREDTELSPDGLRHLVGAFKALIRESAARPFPEEPEEQLWGAIEAVFRSWDTPRAKAYRRVNAISDTLGTAVSVCSMVFGNMGDSSGTGVAFTRNPSTGAKEFFGEFL